MPEAAMMSMMGGIVGALAIIIWWLFLSRAPWVERVGAIALITLALVATSNVVHESISTGMMGMMLFILGVQVATFALAVSAVATGRLSTRTRRASMTIAILIACGSFGLLRTGGITGTGDSDLHWRWTPSPEERLLARAGDAPVTPPASQPAAPVEQPLTDLTDDGPSAPANDAEAKTPRRHLR
jgi:outer membrane protein assembly factor BamB